MNTEQALLQTLNIRAQVKKIQVGRFHINYLTAGTGPPLLLIHGGNIGWGQWYPNIKTLAQHFSLYCIDLPGSGRSSRINYDSLDMEHDLVTPARQFIEKLNLDNVSIVGSSAGGWIALRLALTMPERIKKLVLANSLGFTDYLSVSDRIIGIYPFAKLLSKTVFRPTHRNKNIEKLLRSVFADPATPLRREFIDYFYETMETSHNLLFISKMSSFWGIRKEFKMAKDLPEIRNQTLVIWGERCKFMPIEKVRRNIALLPNAKLKVFPNIGHIPSLEKSAKFNEKVVQFLGAPSSL